MRLLLDTHVVLWWLLEPHRLGVDATQAVGDGANDVVVSAVTAWEVAIKRRLGRLGAPAALEAGVDAEGFRSWTSRSPTRQSPAPSRCTTATRSTASSSGRRRWST